MPLLICWSSDFSEAGTWLSKSWNGASETPPLASVPHKDPRAPQNLVPIGGLERELRHRLGDQHILYRALRAAATTT